MDVAKTPRNFCEVYGCSLSLSLSLCLSVSLFFSRPSFSRPVAGSGVGGWGGGTPARGARRRRARLSPPSPPQILHPLLPAMRHLLSLSLSLSFRARLRGLLFGKGVLGLNLMLASCEGWSCTCTDAVGWWVCLSASLLFLCSVLSSSRFLSLASASDQNYPAQTLLGKLSSELIREDRVVAARQSLLLRNLWATCCRFFVQTHPVLVARSFVMHCHASWDFGLYAVGFCLAYAVSVVPCIRESWAICCRLLSVLLCPF